MGIVMSRMAQMADGSGYLPQDSLAWWQESIERVWAGLGELMMLSGGHKCQ